MNVFKKFLILLLVVIGIVALGTGCDNSRNCDHDWIERNVEEARISTATCDTPAIYYKSCSKCKTISDTLTFEGEHATGHTEVCDPVDANLISAANCENPAKYKKYCSVCQADLGSFESGSALGHSYVEKQDKKYQVFEQSCENAETYMKSCSVCGVAHASEYFVVGEALGHNYVEEQHKDHLYLEQGCENPLTYYVSCANCNSNDTTQTFTVGEALGHNYIEQRMPQFQFSPKDCENAAVYYKSCEHCQQKSDETFTYGEPYGHNFVENQDKRYMVDASATCGDTPEYYVVCSRCEAHTEDNKTFVGDVLSHNFIVIDGVEVTETTHGEEKHMICTVCNTLIDLTGNTIDAVEIIHNYVWYHTETSHYKACSVAGCDAPHLEEGEHTFDEEGCDVTCNGECGYERESQHIDENNDGVCETCGGNAPAPETGGNEDELENLTPWMPL